MISIAVSVASVISPVCRFLSIGGQKYYSRFFSRNELLYTTLVNILHLYRDCKYTHSLCKTFDNIEIAADMMSFRNPAGKWDYSDWATMKVRIQYNQETCAIVVMCKKQYQLESFLNKFSKKDFNPSIELIVIGSS